MHKDIFTFQAVGEFVHENFGWGVPVFLSPLSQYPLNLLGNSDQTWCVRRRWSRRGKEAGRSLRPSLWKPPWGLLARAQGRRDMLVSAARMLQFKLDKFWGRFDLGTPCAGWVMSTGSVGLPPQGGMLTRLAWEDGRRAGCGVVLRPFRRQVKPQGASVICGGCYSGLRIFLGEMRGDERDVEERVLLW